MTSFGCGTQDEFLKPNQNEHASTMNNCSALSESTSVESFVFCMRPVKSHIIPTFALAAELRGRGHRVYYIGFDWDALLVSRNNFEFLSLGGTEQFIDIFRHIRRLRLVTAFRVAKTLVDRAAELIRKVGRPLVLVDVDMQAIVPTLIEYDLKYIFVYTSGMKFPAGWFRPSQNSYTGASGGRVARTISYLVNKIALMIQPRYFASMLWGPEKWMRNAARQHSLKTYDSVDGLCLAGPSIITGPSYLGESLPFPALYTGNNVYADRNDFDSGVQAEKSRVDIVCTLGTKSARYRSRQRWLAQCLEVGAKHPSFHILIHASAEEVRKAGLNLPNNVRVEPEIDMLRVLIGARAAIIHGGFGTICECIARGVTMIVCPCKWDQFRNSARIQQLGIGIGLRRVPLRASTLLSSIEQLLQQPKFKSQLEHLISKEKGTFDLKQCADWVCAGSQNDSK